jgi:CRP-like cAMP-binding protein
MNNHIILFNQMIEVMRGFYPNLSNGFILQLREYIRFIDHNAGEIILHYKEVQKVAWFQGSGISAEITDPFGIAIINFFWFAKDFLFTTPGFFSQDESESSILIIEDSTFAYISAQDFAKLKQQFPEAEILSEKLRNHYKALNMQRTIDNKRKTIIRVKELYRQHERLFELCSKKQLAGYLGMEPDTLTRAMKKLGLKIKKEGKE